MSKKTYFEKPTQVKFWEQNEESYIGGIAYRDEIICGCCGGILSIEDIYENAAYDREVGEAVPAESKLIKELAWIELSDYIAGDYDEPNDREIIETTTEPPKTH